MAAIPYSKVPKIIRERVRYTDEGALDLSDPISDFALRWALLRRVWGCDARNIEVSMGASGDTYRLVGFDERTTMHYGIMAVADPDETPGVLVMIGDDTLTAIVRIPTFPQPPDLAMLLILLDVTELDTHAAPMRDAARMHAAHVSATTDA
jgi:hypothetical protein